MAELQYDLGGKPMSILSKAFQYRKRRSLRFYKYFLSYIVLLVAILAIVGIVVYTNFILALRTEIEISNVSALTQVKNTMDMRLKEMERVVVNINSNVSLKPYKITEGGLDSLEAVKELGKYKSSNGFIYDIALYCDYRGNERIFTPNMDTNLDTFFSYVYKYEKWGKNNFVHLRDTMAFPQMIPVEPVQMNKSDDGGKIFATYVYPLPFNSNNSRSVALFMIDNNILKDMMSSAIKESAGYVYILDEQNNPIAYLEAGKDNLSSSDILAPVNKIATQNDIDEIVLKGKKYSFVKLKSEYNQWSYITVVPKNQFMQKVYTNRKMFNFVTFIALLLGAVLAFTFAKGSYTPLHKLLETVSAHSKSPGAEGYVDEFEYISSAIHAVSRENTGLVKQLKSKAGMMKGELLLRLLKGKPVDLDDIKSMGEISGVRLGYPYFTVLVFLIDDYSQFKKENDEKTQNLIMFSIINVVEELAQEVGCGYGVELIDDRGITLLLNSKAEYNRERYISEISFKTKDFFKQHFGLTLTAGVGNTYDDIVKVHESFLEANRAVYYRLIKGYDHVIFYEEEKENQEMEYRYPADLETELILAMKQGKSSEVERITKEIKNYLVESMMSPESIQCICFSIINAVIKCLDEMNVEVKDCFSDERESLFAQPFETVDDLGDRLMVFSNKICNYIEQQKESKNFGLRDKILKFINEHYNDSGLCLEVIAAECGGLSPSYVSRYYKDQTGYPLMQYIDMLRMNKAKQLLKQTSLPLKEVINQVGYIDESNFIRKFKKKEGVTPTQYRNMV